MKSTLQNAIMVLESHGKNPNFYFYVILLHNVLLKLYTSIETLNVQKHAEIVHNF